MNMRTQQIMILSLLQGSAALWQDGTDCVPPMRCYIVKEILGCKSTKHCCDRDSAAWLNTERLRVMSQILNRGHRPVRIPYAANEDPYVESFNAHLAKLTDYSEYSGMAGYLSEAQMIAIQYPQYIGERVVILDCRDTRPYPPPISPPLWEVSLFDILPILNAFVFAPFPDYTIYLLDYNHTEVKYRKAIFFVCPEDWIIIEEPAVTYGGRTPEVHLALYNEDHPTSLEKTEITCVPPAKDPNVEMVEIDHRGEKRGAEKFEMMRDFKRQRECVDSAPTQPMDQIMLTADTGIRSRRLHGDFATITPKTDSRESEHMPAGYRWKLNVGPRVPIGTTYRGCVQMSSHQPYSAIDGVLRIGVYTPVS